MRPTPNPPPVLGPLQLIPDPKGTWVLPKAQKKDVCVFRALESTPGPTLTPHTMGQEEEVGFWVGLGSSWKDSSLQGCPSPLGLAGTGQRGPRPAQHEDDDCGGGGHVAHCGRHPRRVRSTPSVLTYLGTALLCPRPCSQGPPQALGSAHTSDALLEHSLPRLLLGCPSGHPAHTQGSATITPRPVSHPSVYRSHGHFFLSLGFLLPWGGLCLSWALVPALPWRGLLLAASQSWPANHPHPFPRSPAGDTPSQGPGQPSLLALGQLQSPMTLQTSEQVEAVPHNTTGLGGQDTHSGARTGQASSANEQWALLEGPAPPWTQRELGGLAAVVARPPPTGHMVLGVQSRGGHGPQEGVTLPLPRNGEALELTGRLAGPL